MQLSRSGIEGLSGALMATASEPTGTLRGPLSQQVGFIELLFDVVFVFAFTQLAQRLANDLSWYGLYRALVLLLAVWWVWYRMVWTTNRYDPDRPAIQLMVLTTMLASLLMSAALPAAFRRHDLGMVFGWIYVAVQTLRHAGLVLLGGSRHAQLVSVRVLLHRRHPRLPHPPTGPRRPARPEGRRPASSRALPSG
jgi:low temperature requirement protein LtrA